MAGSFGLSVMKSGLRPRGGAKTPRPSPRPGPARMTNADRPPSMGGPARRRAYLPRYGPPPTRRRPCMAPLRPLAPGCPRGSPRRPAWSRFRRARAAAPSYASPGPAGPTQLSAAPVRCPLLQRPGAPLSPSALRPAGRARAGASSLPKPGPCRLPMRPRRECRTAVPSYVSPAPRRSPSYVSKRSDPRHRQQLFPDFFQRLLPAAPSRAFAQLNAVKAVNGPPC